MGEALRKIEPAMLERILPQPTLEWFDLEPARTLLGKADAYERLADWFTGQDEGAIAKAFTDTAEELDCQISDHRSDTLADIMAACPHAEKSPAWDDAYDEAEDAMPTVRYAMNRARREHWGDAFLADLRRAAL